MVSQNKKSSKPKKSTIETVVSLCCCFYTKSKTEKLPNDSKFIKIERDNASNGLSANIEKINPKKIELNAPNLQPLSSQMPTHRNNPFDNENNDCLEEEEEEKIENDFFENNIEELPISQSSLSLENETLNSDINKLRKYIEGEDLQLNRNKSQSEIELSSSDGSATFNNNPQNSQYPNISFYSISQDHQLNMREINTQINDDDDDENNIDELNLPPSPHFQSIHSSNLNISQNDNMEDDNNLWNFQQVNGIQRTVNITVNGINENIDIATQTIIQQNFERENRLQRINNNFQEDVYPHLGQRYRSSNGNLFNDAPGISRYSSSFEELSQEEIELEEMVPNLHYTSLIRQQYRLRYRPVLPSNLNQRLNMSPDSLNTNWMVNNLGRNQMNYSSADSQSRFPNNPHIDIILDDLDMISNRPEHQSNKQKILEILIQADISKEDECNICLMNFKEKPEAYHLGCNHYYHKDCILEWVVLKGNCPVCRRVYLKVRR